MAEISSVVEEFLTEDEWPYQLLESDEGTVIIQTGFRGDNGGWSCFIQERTEQEQLAFYSICPLIVPEDLRIAMAEFITRANNGLVMGNFEMDLENGELRFKTSLDIQGGSLTKMMVKNLIYINVMTLDDYFPGIMSVISSEKEPKEIIESIESEVENVE